MQTFAIIPAAGRSRRMGRPKLLLPWGDSTVIEHVVAAWRASRVDHVIVVLHPDDHELAKLCVGAFTGAPETPPPEMKDSIRFGLEMAADVFRGGGDDAWLVAPADMPTLMPAVIDRMIEAYRRSLRVPGAAPCIWLPRHGSQRGHPVLFPWSLAAEVATLAADEGLNALLDRHPVEYVNVEATGVSGDFDTPEEYERLRARFEP